ncbi:unnamed protein product [Strongylus vulgaris]|uniref:Sushi domain-containing protein n=1 Tax=Strongylus vulgaris TaxID=40348 RepID=A0A3P7JB48_STRVU|nr:unnamed protein product [Strongylus vulgaris]
MSILSWRHIGLGQTCPAMVTTVGATLNYSSQGTFGSYNSGTTVTMTCMSGTPIGATMATCLNGQWYPTTLGTCSTNSIINGIGAQCPALIAPFGGTISQTLGLSGSPAQQGTVATLICPSGVLGTASVLCSNGVWTPPTLGTCNTSTGFGNGLGTSTGSGTYCQYAPVTPAGAILSYSNSALFPPVPPGTTAMARCLNGAAIMGIRHFRTNAWILEVKLCCRCEYFYMHKWSVATKLFWNLW